MYSSNFIDEHRMEVYANNTRRILAASKAARLAISIKNVYWNKHERIENLNLRTGRVFTRIRCSLRLEKYTCLSIHSLSIFCLEINLNYDKIKFS